jgi:hypothetical protein
MSRPLVLAIVALLVLGGCGLDARSLTYPGATVFQPPTKDFHFHYPAPPWDVDPNPQDALIQLSVKATYQAPGTVDYSHQLRVVRVVGTSTADAAAAQVQAEAQAKHVITAGPTPITSMTGDPGTDLQSYEDLPQGRGYFRKTFFATKTAIEGSMIVELALHSAYPPNEQEVEDLVLSFSSGEDPGTPGPDKTQ